MDLSSLQEIRSYQEKCIVKNLSLNLWFRLPDVNHNLFDVTISVVPPITKVYCTMSIRNAPYPGRHRGDDL